MTIIKQLRQDQGRDPKEIANIAGIGVPEYFDLEEHEDDVTTAQPVANIARVAKALGVKASKLYGGASARAISLDELAAKLSDHLTWSGKSVAEFEEEIGWSVDAALADPREFREFNADGLRAVSEAVGIDWFDVLDTVA